MSLHAQTIQLKNPATFIAFSCCHFPLHDEAAISWAIDQIAMNRPNATGAGYHVVNLGDMFEADSASRWPSEYGWGLQDEYEAADKFLFKVRAAAGPDAKLTFLPGNHEANISAIGRIDAKIRSLCDYNHWVQELQFWKQPAIYNYCRHRGCFRLGDVVFSHGYEAGTGASKFESVYFLNQFGLYVHGHTHRPEPVQQVSMTQNARLPYWFANVGTLRQMDTEYMDRKRKHKWGQAVIIGECEINKSPRRNRTWNARLELFRMFDEWADGLKTPN